MSIKALARGTNVATARAQLQIILMVRIFFSSMSTLEIEFGTFPGMWAHLMTVEDYQLLINRGWRRSGQYCYKPTNNTTCCPLYTIKCEAGNFKMSKSHKKILKRMNKFLRDGKREVAEKSDDEGAAGDSNECFQVVPKKVPKGLELNEIQGVVLGGQPEPTKPETSKAVIKEKPHVEAITAKGPCKKAKQLRLERRMQKLAQKGAELMEVKPNKSQEKSLEDFLNEAPLDGAHKLKVCVLRFFSDPFTAFSLPLHYS